ncbi:uncharacterized protein M421DRAFT_102573 [Didymella exigua CBS 183.55]|uniref:Uncharacterized protein n=1 Tax=Didymella exigua CBS 183.55 TaxID=1150837 RepID=A0A6A5RIF6_9PLEO|nr:uncharacterized protein M421DRAFT_102573 [Didymella exigua CBS 183.55]KAF1926216.1 hypothetical protein M421DRAFT_102573 [Didymella exigua CBS 183.55]
MVYSWDDKEAECHRLYVEEKKSLDEVIAHFEAQGFTPSKRAFQTQFKRWDFPSKQNPAHKNPALVARLQQLWERNYTQKEMVDTLQDEGYQINDRELIRLRLRLKLLLRESVPRPRRKQTVDGGTLKKQKKKKAKTLPGKELINQLGNAILAESSESQESSEEEEATYTTVGGDTTTDIQPVQPELEPPTFHPEESLRRQLRQEHLQRESDEKWRTRKRRRRTRGWAGLPADTPGEPPRFPSETTIDEAKAYLRLDNEMYRRLRERFQEICEAEGVVKKTVAGPEKWAQLVQRLIQEDTHLVSVFQQEPPKGQRALSIDVICMDVTKRLRTMETRMTLADAKNALGLNPEQTRQVRAAYIAKLKTARFTNKHEAGEEQWKELKTIWVNESDHLTRALAQGEADPEYARKLRAVEVIARDVTKRQQQEKLTMDPSKQKQIHQGPGPGPAPPVIAPQPERHRQSAVSDYNASTHTSQTNLPTLSPSSDLQIDPSLLLAASDAAVLPSPAYHQPEHHYQSHPEHTQNVQSQASTPHHALHHHYNHDYYPAASSQHSQPMPIYFRLHHLSATSFPSKTVWLSILHTQSVSEIGNLAIREHPGTIALKVEGLVVYRQDQGEREVVVEVSDDEELAAYLSHVKSTGHGKATFVVLLGMASGSYA